MGKQNAFLKGLFDFMRGGPLCKLTWEVEVAEASTSDLLRGWDAGV